MERSGEGCHHLSHGKIRDNRTRKGGDGHLTIHRVDKVAGKPI